MERFLVFAGSDYYPAGGWHDFIGDFANYDEAKAKAMLYHDQRPVGKDRLWWAHIVDLVNLKIIDGPNWVPD